MPDPTYGPKVYRKQGGDELVVASGGRIDGEAGSHIATQGDLVVSKTITGGIKIDPEDPSYSWRDLEGPIIVHNTGPNRPALTTYIGSVEDYAFAAGEHYGPIKFHIPHDWVPGSDLFIHMHWSHNGTDISGSLGVSYLYTYAKGHQQASFHAEKNLALTVGSLSLANTPSMRHRIDEIQLSTPGGSASLLDTDEIEPDGLILMHFDVPTIPTITGGAAKPFIHYVDCHYLSSNVGTKQKAPDFYA